MKKDKKKKTRKNKKPLIPLFAKLLLLLALISFAVLRIADSNPDFAEWVTANLGYPVRRALAALTDALPFSLGIALVVSSPVLLVLIIILAARRRGTRSRIRFFMGTLAILSLIYSSYVFTLGVGYQRAPLASRLGIASAEVNRDSLAETLGILTEECESIIDGIAYADSGSSESDISFDEICDEILVGYERLEADYPELNIKTFDSRAKPVVLSRVMTSLEISGVYTFFTGESNINVHYPDYVTPFTMAHELAHQRGVAKEDEANFVAFLACIRADSAYVKYSAYMNMFEYVASALSRTDKELFREIYQEADGRMRGESAAFNEFYYAHKSELLSKISDFMNDNYLKASGTEGIISYGLVVRLCVAYYADKAV